MGGGGGGWGGGGQKSEGSTRDTASVVSLARLRALAWKTEEAVDRPSRPIT